MTVMLRIAFICCLAVSLNTAWGQTHRIDLLKKDIYAAATSTEKLKAIFSLCEEHQSIYRDTLDKYALLSKQLAIQSDNKEMQAWAAWLMSTSYLRWGWTDSALATVEPHLPDSAPNDYKSRVLYFKLARTKAMCFASKSNFKDALSVLYKLVREAENYKDSTALGLNLNTIASITLARERYKEALSVLSNARSFSPETPRYYSNLAGIYTNTAQAYHKLDQKDSALYFIQKALRLSREVENLNTLATALRVQSTICIGTDRLKLAEASLKEMIEVRKKTNDGPGVIDDNLMLVDFYLQTGQTEKGISICQEGLKQGDIYAGGGQTFTNNINLRLPYYEALAKCYKASGNALLYQETLENIVSAKDSFYQANSAQAIAELQVQYDVQKKENTIIQQKLDLTEKNYLFYGALLFSFLILVIGWLLFRNNRRKQKLKMLLMQQEEKRLSAEAVKEAEEAERKRIAADLHDNLGAYAASIVSTVDLIKLGNQNTRKEVIEELGNNAQSIVSQLSDTIWVLKKDALPLTAISDRLKIFVQRIGLSYPYVSFDVLENVEEDHLLPPAHSFHLFQIIKEAITNALRHSSCTSVTVHVEGNDQWRIAIMDNGKGMTGANNFTEGGNGLANMQHRAQECGWTIEWQHNHPHGTSVSVQAAVKKVIPLI